MLEILNESNDPGFNLAAEQLMLEEIETDDALFMLWQNNPSVVVGRHQNTPDEVDLAYAKGKGISVIRRMTGGGAVYHDMGNLNFTLILDRKELDDPYDFSHLMEPMLEAFECFGIKGERSGRNDITVDGRKVAGGASRITAEKVLYHACILVNTDVDEMQRVLTVGKEKLGGKGVASVGGRVATLRELASTVTVSELSHNLRQVMETSYGIRKVKRFSQDEIARIESLKAERYDLDEWNIGASPKYDIYRAARYPWGGIQLMLRLKAGQIAECAVYGDYFADESAQDFCHALAGTDYTKQALADRLSRIDVGRFFRGAKQDDIVRLMFP